MPVRRLPGVLRHLVRLCRREATVGVARGEGGLAPLAVARGAPAYALRRSRRTGW